MIREEYLEIASHDGSRFAAFLAVPEAGSGPGIVMLQEIFGVNAAMRETARMFAEEGYCVLVPDLFWRTQPRIELGYGPEDTQRAFSLYQGLDHDLAMRDIDSALKRLRELPEADGQAAVLGFCLGGTLALVAGAALSPDAVISFYPVAVLDLPEEATAIKCPTRIHLGETDPMCPPEAAAAIRERFAKNNRVKVHSYPDAGHAFFNPHRQEFNNLASEAALTRSLELIRPLMGPHYDLEAAWEEHAYYEFGLRDADKTIATMNDMPYVNHVPSMTGGLGREELRHFYKHYFVDTNSDDYRVTSISRTLGVNRLVDEMFITFTHDRKMDYFLPGIEPTGRRISIPVCGIVTFRGNKLRQEHIYYDSATALVQIGLLDQSQYPITGAEQAEKVLDRTSHPSNALIPEWSFG